MQSGTYGPPSPEPEQDDLYDLLRGIVERTPWRTEEEQRRFTGLLNRLEELNVFGYLASTTTVPRPNTGGSRR